MKERTAMQTCNIAQLAAIIATALLIFSSNNSKAQTPQNPHGEGFSLDCKLCHTVEDWKVQPTTVKFDHAQTGFPLAGQHKIVTCTACHSSLKFAEASTECSACHLDIHYDQFGTECQRCHTPKSWVDNSSMRQMHQGTQFPLVGVHATLDCQTCHPGGNYVTVPITCDGCHLNDYLATNNPPHTMVDFGTDCKRCHSVLTSGWTDPSFQHTTAFPLQGGHAISNCAQCHNSNLGTLTAECYSCHAIDFNSTTDPNHVVGGFSHDCAPCHTAYGWTPSIFDHNATAFPLTGAHLAIVCSACHTNGQYSSTPTDCYGCHANSYNNVKDPNHVAEEFPFDCMICHSTTTWSPSTFDHGQTQFPLTGAHIETNCSACHISGQYSGISTECFSCHEDAYNGATNPNHLAVGYPHSCQVCHSTTAWSPASFNHDLTNFPLTGAHLTVACETCHTNNQYVGVPTDCYSCHVDAYNGTTDPNHITANFPHECEICHSTTAWTPATFDHSNTNFPLTGAHQAVACAECHINGQYTGTPADCYSCHQENYNGTTDPNHIAAGFPHDCEICHSTTAWTPATFDHSNTNFPLTGAHVTVPCSDCHVNNQYSGTPTECFFCHEDDYNGTTNPNHQSAGFPTNCEICHTTTNWQSVFNHDQLYFPIYSGHHAGTWSTCSDCHPNASNYSEFTCIDCHAHNQSQMNQEHQEVSGYIYASWACLQCHPTGGGGERDMIKKAAPPRRSKR
jgi:hypothetical protein